ncbi:MAG TPA: DUF3822 family protein [Sphingobacteriaceae bacterium]
MQYQPEIIPRGFTITREVAEKTTLLIHFGISSASFCMLDSRGGQVVAVGETAMEGQSPASLEKLISVWDFLTYSYEETRISVDIFHFTFIPLIHYNHVYLADYAKFAKQGPDESARAERIPTAGLANVYAMNRQFEDSLNLHLRNPKIFTQISPFLNGARRISQSSVRWNIFINVKPGAFEIAVIREDGLQYYNIFRFANPEEFNYFVLLVVRNFQPGSESTFLTISGCIEENDILFAILRKYFDRVLLAPAEMIYNLPVPLRNQLPYRYYSLFSLQLCS